MYKVVGKKIREGELQWENNSEIISFLNYL